MSQFSKSGLVFLWLLLIVMLLLLVDAVNESGQRLVTIPYSTFLEQVREKRIQEVTIDESVITGDYVLGKAPKAQQDSSGQTEISEGLDASLGKADGFKTVAPDHDRMVDILEKFGVTINVKEPSDQPWYLLFFVQALPVIIIAALWIFFLRQMQVGAGKGMSFGKSRAKLLTESQPKVTFADVAGIDEARYELEEIIEFLKDPKRFTKLGGRIPKGVLLVGSPGSGKTLLAKAIAGEAGVPFFSISGSDFVEMFVGVGASRVRDLFVQGKKNAPCIIFIDEIDAVGRHRGAGMGGGHDEREQTLNQLLVEMDGFESNEGVILIAATNRPDVLDPALMRPGRFDRRVIVPRPDLHGRLGILKVHTKKTPLAEDVDLKVVARGTPGFSGADLENLVNEAALAAARAGKEMVMREDFEFAKDKVLLGSERRSILLSEKERETTAYHEGGHALVAKMLPGSDPVHKITIVPRGMALGVMTQLPEEDRHTYSRQHFMNQLAVLFGGRVAEMLVFNEMNTGASSDIQRATDLARKMVCEWDMSERMGPVSYSGTEEHVFLGRDLGKPKDHSETTQVEIDNEVRRILDEQYRLAEKLIKENEEALHRIARALIERETVSGDEVDLLINDEPLPELRRDDAAEEPKSAVSESEKKEDD